MASQSQGIQQLLQAEKRAAEKVAEARKSKLSFCSSPLQTELASYLETSSFKIILLAMCVFSNALLY